MDDYKQKPQPQYAVPLSDRMAQYFTFTTKLIYLPAHIYWFVPTEIKTNKADIESIAFRCLNKKSLQLFEVQKNGAVLLNLT